MQQKKKLCIGCNTEQFIFSKKLCAFCAGKNKKPLERKPLGRKSRYKISKQTDKNKEKRKEERACFKEFFPRMIQRIVDEQIRCAECHKHLIPSSISVAHILSKSKHKEIQCNEDNIIFLCPEHHSVFDSSLSNRILMDCFSLAAEKIKSIQHLLTNHSKERLQIENHINETNS